MWAQGVEGVLMSSSTARSSYAALAAAFLGWLFDGFEMGLFPLTGRDALKELLGPQAVGGLDAWFGVITALFLVGAATGGVVFGWLGDRLGRVRAMSLSIITYAVFTGLCGVASSAYEVAGCRFIASLGMGGEWSLGVALLNEVWPGKSRVLVAGLIGAAANLGYMLGAVVSLALSQVLGTVRSVLSLALSSQTVEMLLANNGWRVLMISGAVPALLVFFIRLFVGESEKWKEEKAKGSTGHWASKDLLAVLGGCMAALVIVWCWAPAGPGAGWVATGVTLLMLPLVLLGYLFPVWQYLGRAAATGGQYSRRFIMSRMLLGAGLAGVALIGTWAAIQWAPKWSEELAQNPALHAKDWTQLCTAAGASIASLLAAVAGNWFKRRTTYACLCVATVAAALLFYKTNGDGFTNWFLFTAFIVGGVSATFYGFFPLYFPELFPTQVRATAQGFCFNFGRVLAAIGALQTATLMKAFGGNFAQAGSTMCFVYLVGLVVIWFCPETKGQALPE
jgi:MFS transporter, SHS family, sialic acid transporter